ADGFDGVRASSVATRSTCPARKLGGGLLLVRRVAAGLSRLVGRARVVGGSLLGSHRLGLGGLGATAPCGRRLGLSDGLSVRLGDCLGLVRSRRLGGCGLVRSRRLGSGLGADLPTLVLGLGPRELLAHAGERRRERRVDAALGLLHRVSSAVGPRSLAIPATAALTALGALCSLDARLRRRGDVARLGRGANRRLLGLLEAQAQAMALGVEADDPEL